MKRHMDHMELSCSLGAVRAALLGLEKASANFSDVMAAAETRHSTLAPVSRPARLQCALSYMGDELGVYLSWLRKSKYAFSPGSSWGEAAEVFPSMSDAQTFANGLDPEENRHFIVSSRRSI